MWPRDRLPAAGGIPWRPGAAAISPLPSEHHRPTLDNLAKALAEVEPYFERARAARGRTYINHEGGDVGGHSTERALFRHVANYLAVAELAEDAGLHDSLLDVGSGTGALAAWVADRLGAELHLVDRDANIQRVAAEAFPRAFVHAELDEVARSTVGVVAAMEVVEHVRPPEQQAFVTALLSRVEPGGLLVISTPDESGYLGGWSGYAPHIGCLTAGALDALLRACAPDAAVDVWRLEGDPYRLGPVRRVVQPFANRLWTRLEPLLSPVTHRLVGPATALADLARTHAGPDLVPDVHALPPAEGSGTGLLGVVRMPA